MKSLKQATLIMVHRVFKSKAIGKHSNFDDLASSSGQLVAQAEVQIHIWKV